jgi:hypothetical protein
MLPVDGVTTPLYNARQAADETWGEIAGNFGDDPDRVAVARLKLANAMLSVSDDDSRDVQVLKRAALQAMAKDYRVQSLLAGSSLTAQR